MSDYALRDLENLPGLDNKNEGPLKGAGHGNGVSNEVVQDGVDKETPLPLVSASVNGSESVNAGVMSGNALRDLKNLPGSDKKNEGALKGGGDSNGVSNGAGEEGVAEATPLLLVSAGVNGIEPVSTGAEIGNFEVEYVESEQLIDVDDADDVLKTLLTGLDSKDWVIMCESLNNARRLAIFHKETLLDILNDVIPLLVKSLKNPRSAVCKTAIMAVADVFTAYNDSIVDSLDPLLLQLLLKSSQDKKFVCEAAERTLEAMTTSVSPSLLLPKLQPYLKHRNPRVRAKASMCFSRSLPLLGVEGIKSYGIDKLIQVAASQLNDKLPESREAARTLILELQTVYEKSSDLTTFPDNKELNSWEQFCQSNLSALNAQAVLRVISISREGLVSSS